MTLRPKRHPDDASAEFSDPLKDYNGPDFADELERSLAEDTVTVMQTRPFRVIPPDFTVKQCIDIMSELEIACLLVTENDRLVGVFSERDVLDKVTANFDQMKHQPVSAVMTPSPMTVYETDSPAKAMNLMAVGGFRHIPILDVDDKVVGILGPRRVTNYLEQYFA